jgi:hypothetical protein
VVAVSYTPESGQLLAIATLCTMLARLMRQL